MVFQNIIRRVKNKRRIKIKCQKMMESTEFGPFRIETIFVIFVLNICMKAWLRVQSMSHMTKNKRKHLIRFLIFLLQY